MPGYWNAIGSAGGRQPLGDLLGAELRSGLLDAEKTVLLRIGPVDPQGEARPQDRPEALHLPEQFGDVVEIDLGGGCDWRG